MARITVEDCLDSESNRFKLVRLAAQRAKQLISGSEPVTDTRGNREIVSALREIAVGKVKFTKIESPAETYADPVVFSLPEAKAPEVTTAEIAAPEAGEEKVAEA